VAISSGRPPRTPAPVRLPPACPVAAEEGRPRVRAPATRPGSASPHHGQAPRRGGSRAAASFRIASDSSHHPPDRMALSLHLNYLGDTAKWDSPAGRASAERRTDLRGRLRAGARERVALTLIQPALDCQSVRPRQGRPACQVRVGRDDQKRAHRLRQIQDPVVLQSGRSETVCGGSVIPPPGQSGSRLSQGADDQCSVAAAADMAAEVADKPRPSD
jgi:hypothetical protein